MLILGMKINNYWTKKQSAELKQHYNYVSKTKQVLLAYN